eukprot:Gb_36616 [translate_table: standard]
MKEGDRETKAVLKKVVGDLEIGAGRLNGKAIVGHPVIAETLENGYYDALFTDYNFMSGPFVSYQSTGVIKIGQFMHLDGGYYCASCGRVHELCAMIVEKVEVLLSRISPLGTGLRLTTGDSLPTAWDVGHIEAKCFTKSVEVIRRKIEPMMIKEPLKKCGSFGAGDFGSNNVKGEILSNDIGSSFKVRDPGKILRVAWTHATLLKVATNSWAHMDICKGDVVAWPTNLGWMMGPWLVYASLLNGASMALYNGSPLGYGFTKFVHDAKVTMLGLVLSIVRAWKHTNCIVGLNWSNIRCFSSSGEASSVDEYLWLMGRANYKLVIAYCGGTEIGRGFVVGSMLQAQSLATFNTPAMGCTLFVLGQDHRFAILFLNNF